MTKLLLKAESTLQTKKACFGNCKGLTPLLLEAPMGIILNVKPGFYKQDTILTIGFLTKTLFSIPSFYKRHRSPLIVKAPLRKVNTILTLTMGVMMERVQQQRRVN